MVDDKIEKYLGETQKNTMDWEKLENILYDVFDKNFGVDESIEFIHDLVKNQTEMSPRDIDWEKVEDILWKVWMKDFSVDDAIEKFHDLIYGKF